jgi:hypothetical protein
MRVGEFIVDYDQRVHFADPQAGLYSCRFYRARQAAGLLGAR